MRINLVGNVLNLAFIFGRFLHKKGYRVRAFIDRKSPELYQPHWEFPELKDKLPQWAEVVDVDFKKPSVLGIKEINFIKKLRECDIIQSFGESVIWARWTGRPYVFLSYGADLDKLPFNPKNIKGNIFSCLLKDALKKAAFVLYTMPQQKRSVAKLNLNNNMFFPYAIPIDMERYRPLNQNEKKKLRKRYDFDFIFFHPSRQEWTRRDSSVSSYKGNDKLYRAFAKFVKNDKRRAILIAVEKGRDVKQSKELINQLKISRFVEWIKPVDKRALLEILNKADLCFDNFAYGFYGFAALEALSVGIPTFLHLDCEVLDQSAPPIINVFSENQIYEKMVELTADRNRLTEIGKSSRDWVMKYYHWEKVIDRYLDLYKKVLNTHSKPVK